MNEIVFPTVPGAIAYDIYRIETPTPWLDKLYFCVEPKSELIGRLEVDETCTWCFRGSNSN